MLLWTINLFASKSPVFLTCSTRSWIAVVISGRWIRQFSELMQNAPTTKHNLNYKWQNCLTSANPFFLSFVLQTLVSLFFYFLIHYLSFFFNLSTLCSPSLRLCFHLQSNSLLPESLRNSDKRRNGPEFPNDTKKRKVDDKDSSHYVRNGSADCVFVCAKAWVRKMIYNVTVLICTCIFLCLHRYIIGKC